MTPDRTELLGDPLFQLNTVLWLAQPLRGLDSFVPVLHQRGFQVYAVGPRLAPPPQVRLAAAVAGTAMQAATNPDVVLQHPSQGRFALVECKKTSFGSASSTASQARTLLVMAGEPLAEALGLPPSDVHAGLAAFVLPDPECPAMRETCAALRAGLDASGVGSGPTAVLGLALLGDDLCLQVDEPGSQFFSLDRGSTPFASGDPETDLRPLYFIPYDPDVEQTPKESAFCKRVLFERMQSAVLASVGRARPPVELDFKGELLLKDATFGMSERWENPGTKRHLRRVCRQLMDPLLRSLNSAAPGTGEFVLGTGWRITLRDDVHQEQITDALARFSCETLELNSEPQPSFDDLELPLEF